MQLIKRNSQNTTSHQAHQAAGVPAAGAPSPLAISEDIARRHGAVIDRAQAIIHHPRSLARPLPSWRPPGLTLPAISGSSPLRMTVTRHRVGPRAKARVRGFGETRVPAYLITVRITDPAGGIVNGSLSEGWIRNLVDPGEAGAVHELSTGRAATYVWLVDSSFQPVFSPISMFAGLSDAA